MQNYKISQNFLLKWIHYNMSVFVHFLHEITSNTLFLIDLIQLLAFQEINKFPWIHYGIFQIFNVLKLSPMSVHVSHQHLHIFSTLLANLTPQHYGFWTSPSLTWHNEWPHCLAGILHYCQQCLQMRQKRRGKHVLIPLSIQLVANE